MPEGKVGWEATGKVCPRAPANLSGDGGRLSGWDWWLVLVVVSSPPPPHPDTHRTRLHASTPQTRQHQSPQFHGLIHNQPSSASSPLPRPPQSIACIRPTCRNLPLSACLDPPGLPTLPRTPPCAATPLDDLPRLAPSDSAPAYHWRLVRVRTHPQQEADHRHVPVLSRQVQRGDAFL